MRTTTRLRQMLQAPGLIVAPGAYDGFSARLIEAAGFAAVYMTGAGTAASHLGQPDLGLATMTEMATHARHLASCVSLPLIADADTGYGNALNVVRTVREYERAGVAGLHLEDQVAPKKCGHIAGKQVIPAREFADKIRAAAEYRTDPDFVIIARTDARAVTGLDDAIERGNLYAEAGADVIFVEAPQSEDEIHRVAREVKAPLLANMVQGGRLPPSRSPSWSGSASRSPSSRGVHGRRRVRHRAGFGAPQGHRHRLAGRAGAGPDGHLPARGLRLVARHRGALRALRAVACWGMIHRRRPSQGDPSWQTPSSSRPPARGIGRAYRGALNNTHGATMAGHVIAHAVRARRSGAGRGRGRASWAAPCPRAPPARTSRARRPCARACP